MYEVELKVPADLETVRTRLEDAGTAFEGRVVQEDTYYDAPHRSFPETDEALRVRRESTDGEEATRLTYKGPLVETESKTRTEIETAIESGEAVDAILTSLGFEPVTTVRKERERARIREYTVTLDRVDGVGEFVEVETEAEEDTIDPAREGAIEVLEELDLDADDQIRTSYLELLLEE